MNFIRKSETYTILPKNIINKSKTGWTAYKFVDCNFKIKCSKKLIKLLVKWQILTLNYQKIKDGQNIYIFTWQKIF